MCMLLGVGLPKSFRGEVVTTTTYFINIYPSTRINFKTSMEVWSGKPTYNILINFEGF